MAGDTDLSAVRLAEVVERLPHALAISTAVRDEQGHATDMRLEYLNEQARELQADPAGAIGGRASELWPQLIDNGSFAACLRVLNTGEPESGEFWWATQHSLRPAPFEWRVTRVGAETLVWVLHSVGEAHLQMLAHAAARDALTNLPNRTLLLDRVGTALARQVRAGTATALLLVDIDQFQVINDSLGHAAGDHVLQTVADRLRGAVRPGDTVARLSGDSFVVLCENLDPDGWGLAATDIWRRIRGALAMPVDLEERSFVVSATAGVAGGTDSHASGSMLLRDADTALHAAKRQGRGGCVVFDESLGRRAHQRFDVETGLRRALEGDEIEVYLQPLVDVATQALVGAEALVRWRCDGELRPPAQFLEVAEETGLIVDLSQRVLRLAAETYVAWRARHPAVESLGLAVNVAAQHVAAPSFVADILATIEAAGLPPQALIIEITESAMLNEEIGRSGALQGLRDAGIRVALDDFGTGFSAIGYLRRLPVDILKVDRAFVTSDGTVEHDPQALLRCFVDLARALRLQVVIEGIERPEQLEAARQAGFDLAQGYLLGRPVSLQQFEADHLM